MKAVLVLCFYLLLSYASNFTMDRYLQAGPISNFEQAIEKLKYENAELKQRNFYLESNLKNSLEKLNIAQLHIVALEKEKEEWKETAQYWKDQYDYSKSGNYVNFAQRNAYQNLADENFQLPKRYVYSTIIGAWGIIWLYKGSPVISRKDIFLVSTAAFIYTLYS